MFDLAHLAVRVLEHQLVEPAFLHLGEHPGIGALAARPAGQVAEADVERQPRIHSVHCRVVQRYPVLELPRDDREGGFVELDVVHARPYQRTELVVDDARELVGHLYAIRVCVARTDVHGKREGAGTGNLDGLCGVGARVSVLLDDAQTLRGHDLLDGLVSGRRVIPIETDLPQLGLALDTQNALVEALDEVPPPHLTIGDDVDARLLLIEDGHVHRIVVQLPLVGESIVALLYLVEGGPHPPWVGMASDDCRWQEGLGRQCHHTLRSIVE